MLTIVLHNITLIIQYDLVHNEFLENIFMSGKLFRYYSLYSVYFIMLGKKIITVSFLYDFYVILFILFKCSIMNVKLCSTLILSMLRSLLLDTP